MHVTSTSPLDLSPTFQMATDGGTTGGGTFVKPNQNTCELEDLGHEES